MSIASSVARANAGGALTAKAVSFASAPIFLSSPISRLAAFAHLKLYSLISWAGAIASAVAFVMASGAFNPLSIFSGRVEAVSGSEGKAERVTADFNLTAARWAERRRRAVGGVGWRCGRCLKVRSFGTMGVSSHIGLRRASPYWRGPCGWSS